jgi:hypothetical protein
VIEVNHRPLGSPAAEHFDGKDLADALEAVTGWLRANPDISVLSISLDSGGEGESVDVFYE